MHKHITTTTPPWLDKALSSMQAHKKRKTLKGRARDGQEG